MYLVYSAKLWKPWSVPWDPVISLQVLHIFKYKLDTSTDSTLLDDFFNTPEVCVYSRLPNITLIH